MSERHLTGTLHKIGREEYEAFAALKHLFLVGNLQQETPHPFVRDERLEVIVCIYKPDDFGLPHWHREVTEYEIVMEGEVGHLDVATGETTWFRAGDLRVLPPGVCTRRIIRVPTRTFAIKVPSSAEKVCCTACSRDCDMRLAPCLEDQCVSQ